MCVPMSPKVLIANLPLLGQLGEVPRHAAIGVYPEQLAHLAPGVGLCDSFRKVLFAVLVGSVGFYGAEGET